MPGPGQMGVPAPRPLPARPRKVRAGVKVPAGDIAGPAAWAAHRWLRLLEQSAEGQVLVEGLEYARLGQTKRISIAPGSIAGSVQGRADRAYTTTISLSTFTPEQWDKVVDTMSEGAIYAAKLLAGELPPNIEDVFVPLGLKLFPTERDELKVTCDCEAINAAYRSAFSAAELRAGRPALPPPSTPPPKDGWCKHVACVGYLVGHKLATEPFLMFALRGLDGQQLLERLRHKRFLAGAAGGATPVYPQRVPGVSDVPFPPLEDALEQFWEAGSSLQELDLPLSPPQVSHPLLRRLGPSPFQNAQFPLVGLLASCYETISEAARKTEEGLPPSQAHDPEPEPQPEEVFLDDESPDPGAI
jgi:uncharacterized Zn finger protein